MAKKPIKEESTALVKWDEELADAAAEQTAVSTKGGGGNFISLKSGVMSYQGEDIPENTLRAVVLDFIYENQFYEGRFDPDARSSPVCYAFSRDEDDMAPHDESAEPQSSACEGCEHNEFGSADTGRGKACKNVVRLALIPEDALDDLEALDAEQVVYLKVSVTSKQNWDKYYKKYCHGAAGKRPTYFYVTEISVVPDAKSQFKVNFNAVDNLKDRETGSAEFKALKKKTSGMGDDIIFTYPKPEEIEQPKKKNKFSKKR